jgi:DNA-binding CsgD family transcriptional regulator
VEERNVLVMSFALLRQRVPPSLTSAERDVVRRVLGGASNAQIARARGSSPRTVANQLVSIFRKLGIFSRTELAQRLALADLDDDS